MVVDPAELKDLIEPKDLTGDLALISSVCGLDVAKAIATELSGVSLYISDAALNPSRVRLAKKLSRKGWHSKRIAAYLGVSERWLRNQLGGAGNLDQLYLEGLGGEA